MAMKKYKHQDWLDELKHRFGSDMDNWAFVCPSCGKVSTGAEFKAVGASSDDLYVHCIGRHTGQGAPKKDSNKGCNWAAYGLFGTLGKGEIVVTEEGKQVSVFAMAEKGWNSGKA